MREYIGDMWVFAGTRLQPVVVITTNGFVKRDGSAVMGRGCAAQAAQRWPDIPKQLGHLLQTKGNHVHQLVAPKYTLLTMPVKPVSVVCSAARSNVVRHMRHSFKHGDLVPGWAATADLDMILQSACELIALCDRHPEWTEVLMPQPGCGAGELQWTDVQPELNKLLDDRFVVCTYK